VMRGNLQLFCLIDSCVICQPWSVCVQGCFPTPQPENEVSQVAAVAPQVIVSRPSRAASNVKIPRRDKKF
jgi:hypothetical protein